MTAAEPPESTLAAVLAVHERYFDLDGTPGEDDTTPEPEDVWRYDRDFRAAILAATTTAAELEAALAAAEARLRAVEALYLRRDVAYPVKFKFGAADNYVAGYRAAQCDIRDALTPPQLAP